jgi:hypothetical protein
MLAAVSSLTSFLITFETIFTASSLVPLFAVRVPEEIAVNKSTKSGEEGRFGGPTESLALSGFRVLWVAYFVVSRNNSTSSELEELDGPVLSPRLLKYRVAPFLVMVSPELAEVRLGDFRSPLFRSLIFLITFVFRDLLRTSCSEELLDERGLVKKSSSPIEASETSADAKAALDSADVEAIGLDCFFSDILEFL